MRPALLIRPREKYRYGMAEPEMCEITRREWRMKQRAYKFVFCVHDGIIRGVWSVDGWDLDPNITPGRRGLALAPTDEAMSANYLGGSVVHLLPLKGGQNPITVLL